MLTRFILSITLLCASVAWAGWVFLHTVGDPHRAERIAHAMLDSPDARDEIAVPLTDQIVNNAQLDAQTQQQLRSVVSDVLADPRIVDNFADAFGTAQANALGIGERRPAVIDVGAMVEVVREHVARDFPELAAQIPASTQRIELPEVQTTALADVRRLADTWTIWLGLFSVISLITLMVFGDRRMVLRSFGLWAIFTGIAYVVGPRLIPLFVRSYAPQADGVVKAMVDSVSPQITTAATVLVVLGVLAFVARFTVFRNQGLVYAPGTMSSYGPGVAPQPVTPQYAPVGYGTPASMYPTQASPAGGPYSAPYPTQVYPAGDPYSAPGAPQYPSQAYPPAHTVPSAPSADPYATSAAPDAYGAAPPTPPSMTGPAWAVPPSGRQPRTPISDQWSTDASMAHPEPEPILLRPLDLPTSNDNLHRLTHPDE